VNLTVRASQPNYIWLAHSEPGAAGKALQGIGNGISRGPGEHRHELPTGLVKRLD
jgi:hypothetical protein